LRCGGCSVTPHVQARWPLGSEAIEKYVVYLALSGEIVESVPPSTSIVISDPDDDPILQTALVGRADVLCTRDAAFRHPAVKEYCRLQGIRIMTDVDLMRELRSQGEQ
jgi:predicted nucleic acid-binding protein